MAVHEDAQFTQLRSISADWRTGAERTAVPRGARAVIEVWEILYYVTELTELAARLALLSGADEFHLAAELHGMAAASWSPARRHVSWTLTTSASMT